MVSFIFFVSANPSPETSDDAVVDPSASPTADDEIVDDSFASFTAAEEMTDDYFASFASDEDITDDFFASLAGVSSLAPQPAKANIMAQPTAIILFIFIIQNLLIFIT